MCVACVSGVCMHACVCSRKVGEWCGAQRMITLRTTFPGSLWEHIRGTFFGATLDLMNSYLYGSRPGTPHDSNSQCSWRAGG